MPSRARTSAAIPPRADPQPLPVVRRRQRSRDRVGQPRGRRRVGGGQTRPTRPAAASPGRRRPRTPRPAARRTRPPRRPARTAPARCSAPPAGRPCAISSFRRCESTQPTASSGTPASVAARRIAGRSGPSPAIIRVSGRPSRSAAARTADGKSRPPFSSVSRPTISTRPENARGDGGCGSGSHPGGNSGTTATRSAGTPLRRYSSAMWRLATSTARWPREHRRPSPLKPVRAEGGQRVQPATAAGVIQRGNSGRTAWNTDAGSGSRTAWTR